MNPPSYLVRRATVDDLGGLKILWERARLQVLDLEKHLTEFQLIASDEGDLIGAIGIHLEGKQGQLHSEAFAQADQQDEFRSLLWNRIQSLARNHGLVRLWMREAAPYWQQAGFESATEESLKRLPASFGGPNAAWSALQLKEENANVISLEKEFELFQLAQRDQTEKMMDQARVLKVIAGVIATVFLIAVVVLGIFAYRKYQRVKDRDAVPVRDAR